MRVLGRTKDDAAGECFDKAARVLGLGYPGGPKMEALAKGGDPAAYRLPRANISGHPLDMSFSGLKTAVVNLVHNAEQKQEALDKKGLAASFEQAVSDVLVSRTMEAARVTGRSAIVAAGGVAANGQIRAALSKAVHEAGKTLYLPPLRFCGDNAAMIGAQGYYEFLAGRTAGMELNAYASMDIELKGR